METVLIQIHKTQVPDRVRHDLIISLRTRKVNHKFHYDSIKQTQKWLALHEAYSPARKDPDCGRIYDACFRAAAETVKGKKAHVIGLGCGGGQKDAALVRLLKQKGNRIGYTPCDVGSAMVLVAREAVGGAVGEKNCFPFVCDLARAEDLDPIFKQHAKGATRIFTFFGMIPNFEPGMILPKLAKLIGRSDVLLFSANLAPGTDYLRGIKKVLPLYENELTSEWLMTFLLDLGVERGDGKIRFQIEGDPSGSELKRIAAYFQFSKARMIKIGKQVFRFRKGERIRLFFSYRHTPSLVQELLARYGLKVEQSWIARSEEEGVFLCRRI